jgi:hypothetical protein
VKTSEFLAALLLDWHGTIRKPKAARAVLFSVKTFPGFTGQLVRQILLRNGDWRAAVADLLDNRGNVPALPQARVLAFQKWAEKITARPVRGLLTWKGGAA